MRKEAFPKKKGKRGEKREDFFLCSVKTEHGKEGKGERRESGNRCSKFWEAPAGRREINYRRSHFSWPCLLASQTTSLSSDRSRTYVSSN